MEQLSASKDLRKIDRAFFDEYATGDPNEAWQAWNQWLSAPHRRLTDEARRRALMMICADLSGVAVRHYLHNRHHFLSRESLDTFDRIRKGLGQSPVPRSEPVNLVGRRTNRVALLTQLQVPSESFHLELVRGIVRNAQIHHLATAVHEVSPLDLGSSIERVRAAFRPDGFILLRLTPSQADLRRLAGMDKPLVLVHADRYRYPKPVLANIIPNQEWLGRELESWIKRNPRSALPVRARKFPKNSKAVLITMPQESSTSAFPPVASNVEPSIRNDRIARLTRALGGFDLVVEEVPDYRFIHALRVFRQHPDADLYVSLSDQVAVGLKHLLIVARRPWQHKIVGFDDSPLAKEEQVASYCQSLDQIGRAVVDQLCRFRDQGVGGWPEFQELFTDVHLEMRCDSE